MDRETLLGISWLSEQGWRIRRGGHESMGIRAAVEFYIALVNRSYPPHCCQSPKNLGDVHNAQY